jgi:hypothetical protein
MRHEDYQPFESTEVGADPFDAVAELGASMTPATNASTSASDPTEKGLRAPSTPLTTDTASSLLWMIDEASGKTCVLAFDDRGEAPARPEFCVSSWLGPPF